MAGTVVVGSGTPGVYTLRDAAERAFWDAARPLRAGQPFRSIGRAVWRSVRSSGFRVISALTGHAIGRRIHEEPSIPNFDDGNDALIPSGQVLTIEPMITKGWGEVYELAVGWTVATVDGAPAAHYEHTVVVWDDRIEVLTAGD